jgi:hypothetical protein
MVPFVTNMIPPFSGKDAWLLADTLRQLYYLTFQRCSHWRVTEERAMQIEKDSLSTKKNAEISGTYNSATKRDM